MSDSGKEKRDSPFNTVEIELRTRRVARSTGEFLQIDFGSHDPSAGEMTNLVQIHQWCRKALEARGSIAGLVAIARVADAYNDMAKEERYGFYRMLLSDFAVDQGEVDRAIDEYRAATGARTQELQRLIATLDSPRLQLFRQFNTIPESIKFLVDLRADLNARLKRDPSLRLMEFELQHLLESWLNLGFLKLHRITWDSPARLLEKLVEYEAVHEIGDWMDLKRRLGSDRACFAFIHPSMPSEPIIFVEIALVKGISSNVQELLGPGAEHLQPHQADTAIFYSITNAQRGLRGIPFGNMLIKKVTAQLRNEVPNLTTFATLSPIPRLMSDFLDPLLVDGGMERFYTGDEAEQVMALSSAGRPAADRDLTSAVTSLLAREAWCEDPEASAALRPGLQRAAKYYLTHEMRREHLACPVAHFHAGNGAVLARINWLGDTSPKGLEQSAGIMVNYLYDLDSVEQYQELYAETRVLPTGPEVTSL